MGPVGGDSGIVLSFGDPPLLSTLLCISLLPASATQAQ